MKYRKDTYSFSRKPFINNLRRIKSKEVKSFRKAKKERLRKSLFESLGLGHEYTSNESDRFYIMETEEKVVEEAEAEEKGKSQIVILVKRVEEQKENEN